MPAKIAAATLQTDGYHVVVHLDTARVLEDGRPDPTWVEEWVWSRLDPELHTQHGAPLTEEQHLENIRGMLPELIERAVYQRQLAEEGPLAVSGAPGGAAPLASLAGLEFP